MRIKLLSKPSLKRVTGESGTSNLNEVGESSKSCFQADDLSETGRQLEYVTYGDKRYSGDDGYENVVVKSSINRTEGSHKNDSSSVRNSGMKTSDFKCYNSGCKIMKRSPGNKIYHEKQVYVCLKNKPLTYA